MTNWSYQSGGVLTLEVSTEDGDVAELEFVDDRLVVWAMTPGPLVASIDGVEQDTGSRTIALPAEMLSLPVKSFVKLVFEGQPGARPAGAPSPQRLPGLWLRLMRWTKALTPTWVRFDRRR